MSEDPSAAPETPSLPRWRGILAGLSLVLGMMTCLAGALNFLVGAAGIDVLSFILWAVTFLSAFTAILFGIVAGRSLPRIDRLAPGSRAGKVGITSGSVGITIGCLYALVHPALIPADIGHKVTCQNNLKQIGVIMKMYTGENQGTLPDTLSRTYPEYAPDLTVFVCTQSGNKPGDPTHIDEWSDYAYVSGLRVTVTPADAQALVCYEKVYTNHEPPARNELYLDGRVEARAPKGAFPSSQ